jgi:hypothetical protein
MKKPFNYQRFERRVQAYNLASRDSAIYLRELKKEADAEGIKLTISEKLESKNGFVFPYIEIKMKE